ncbi:DUF6088 family protein [Alcaligenes faecalis]|uniref:DUF6088 family protein n=1 Tax=Alcaligenes faecalis TaxID=511 RepID=UPI001EF0A50A|nr:DUF6088 family protein [Alcaligenes faecalis]ULH06459.1 DUF6088 family protein [Alcaligenes faecalis]
MKLEDRLLRSVKKRSGNVILRADVASLGSPTQLTQALNALQSKGVLVRIGKGVYAKTKRSAVTGNKVPAGSLESLSKEVMGKLGVKTYPSQSSTSYNSGKTTQVPGKLVINTGARRIQRKITVGGRGLVYENDYQRAKPDA